MDLFNEKIPDTRSGKSKADEGEQNSEVMKKQKEEFDVTILKLQERIATLELEKDESEQYGRRVCVRIDDVPVAPEETADSGYEKVG